MADLEKIKEETKKTIRSLLLSCKDGQPLRLLERDHMDIMGAPIPFKKLGFNSSANLLSQMPDVCRLAINKQGEQVYKGVADETTAHIAALVSNQKSKKVKKSAKFRSLPSRRPKTASYSYRPSNKYVPSFSSNQQRPPPSYNSSRPSYRGGGAARSRWDDNGSWWPGERYSTASSSKPNDLAAWHGGAARPRTNFASRPLSTRPKPLLSTPTQIQPTSLSVTVKNKQDPNRKQTEAEVRQNITELIRSNSTGVWYHMLSDMYRGFFNLNLPKEYLDCVLDWSDILTHENMHGKPIIYPATEESKAKARASKSTSSSSISVAVGPAGHYNDFRSDGIPSPDQFYIGQQCNVYICHVPDKIEKIYVQCENSAINKLMEEISSHYESATLKTYTEIPANCVCAAKDKEFQAWNRAFVAHTDNKTKAELLYVDFGNYEIQELSSLQPLTARFLNIPAQAVPITLYNIESTNPTLLAKEFKSITDNRLLILICQSFIDGCCSVVLFDSEETSISINQKLVDIGLAQWEQPDLPIPKLKGISTSKSNEGGISSQSASHITQNSYASQNNSTPNGKTMLPKLDLEKIESMSSIHSVDSSSSTSSVIEPTTPVGEDYWTVMVTHVISPNEVYLRVESTSSELYNEFMEEVECVYENEQPMSLLVMDDIYLAQVTDEDGPGWYRVRAKELLNRNTVECELIDFGSMASVDRKNMYTLREKYRKIPIQTCLCLLWGLDQVTEDTVGALEKLVDMTSGKTLIAQHIDNEHGIPQVVLFDTSAEEDIEINSEIGKLMTDTKLAAHLPAPGKTTDVSLTYIERDGTCFVQLIGPGVGKLEELMNEINDYYTKQKTTAQDFVTGPQIGDLVCAKYEGTWYRANIQSTNNQEKKVEVYYGDYGNTSTIPMSQLRRIPADIKHAKTLPMQALECKLSGLDGWNDDVGAEAAMLINSEEHYVLMTVTAATETEPAKVQLSQNSFSVNNQLLKIYEETLSQSGETPSSHTTSVPSVAMQRNNSVNNTITNHSNSAHPSNTDISSVPARPGDALHSPTTPPGSPPDDYPSTSKPGEKPTDKMSKLMKGDLSKAGAGDYVSSKLEALNISDDYVPPFVQPPDAGAFWDVFVTTTNEPDHFVVVPLAEIRKLNDLIENLHTEYECVEGESFTPRQGDLCAGLSTHDGYWYRVLIIDNKLIAGRVKVLFADYGNYDFIEPEMIRPLKKKYKTLPLQAVRAGLFDIIPAEGNIWTPESKRDFIYLCNEKKLVATIKSVQREKTLLNPGPSVLFELHDTTGESNINIDSELVRMGHAKYKQNLH